MHNPEQLDADASKAAILASATTAPIHIITGADVDAIAPLFAHLSISTELTAGNITSAIPLAVTALAQLLGIHRAALASLPMHNILQLIADTVPRWAAVNAPYIADTLTPEINRIGALAAKFKPV